MAAGACWPRDASGHGQGSRRYRRAATAHRHGGNEDTGSDSNHGGTGNNRQSTKSSQQRRAPVGSATPAGMAEAAATTAVLPPEVWRQRGGGGQLGGNGGSLARAWRWWRRQRSGGVGSGKMDRVLLKFLRLYLHRLHTDRISDEVPKKLLWNHNCRNSCFHPLSQEFFPGLLAGQYPGIRRIPLDYCSRQNLCG